MTKCIIFQMADMPLSIIYPCTTELTPEQVGVKDVPNGIPFWVVDVSALPTDREYRAAWFIDPAQMGEPDGIGMRDA